MSSLCAPKTIDAFKLIAISVNVDVDWMDPEYIKSMPIKPHDQTSNQLWVDIQLHHPSNADLLVETAKELKDKGWLAIYTRMVHQTPLSINEQNND